MFNSEALGRSHGSFNLISSCKSSFEYNFRFRGFKYRKNRCWWSRSLLLKSLLMKHDILLPKESFPLLNNYSYLIFLFQEKKGGENTINGLQAYLKFKRISIHYCTMLERFNFACVEYHMISGSIMMNQLSLEISIISEIFYQ